MFLEYFNTQIDANFWEILCDDCYRLRYQSENYQKIPSVYKGDGGIEGYTKTGIVYQSYFPIKDYTTNELYEHLRDKVTNDIDKLKNSKNINFLKSLGVPLIKEWHFVTPKYNDTRILEHIKIKTDEIKELRETNQNVNSFIDANFDIIIKVADDFKEEISKLIILNKGEIKINLAVLDEENIDYSKCESTKVANITRKIKAISSPDKDQKSIDKVISIYIKFYLKGIELLNDLKVNYPLQHKEIFNLTNAYKDGVAAKTTLSTSNNFTINKRLFDDITNEFSTRLEEFKFLTNASIEELKNDIISGWLADCTMEFEI